MYDSPRDPDYFSIKDLRHVFSALNIADCFVLMVENIKSTLDAHDTGTTLIDYLYSYDFQHSIYFLC